MTTPWQNVCACVNFGHFQLCTPLMCCWVVQINSVVRLAVFELVVRNQQGKDRKYIKGMYTLTCCNHWSWNCSLDFLRNSLQWPPLLIMELDVAFWHQIHVRQLSFQFVQQTEQFSACQKLCSSLYPNFDGYFYRKKSVHYTRVNTVVSLLILRVVDLCLFFSICCLD